MRDLSILRASALVLALGATLAASADQLVYNGGFETADASGVYGDGWGFTSVAGYQKAYIFDDFTSPGYDFPEAPPTVTAFLGYEDGNTDTIFQTIDTAHHGSANLTLDIKSDGYDKPGFDFLTIKFGADTVATIDVGNDDTPFTLHPSYDLSPYFDGTKKDLSIAVSLDPGFYTNTYVWVDNVSIVAQAVPEPAPMAVLGLGALALLRRHKR